MDKKVAIGIGIGIVIIIGIIIYQMDTETRMQEGWSVLPPNPQTNGPLTINKDQYLIGEVVFLNMELNPLENGEVTVVKEGSQRVIYGFKFNGSGDPSPNMYFRPMLDWTSQLCTVDDLIGTWNVVISGVTLMDDRMGLTKEPRLIQFEILDQIVEYDTRFESWTLNVCENKDAYIGQTPYEAPMGSGMDMEQLADP